MPTTFQTGSLGLREASISWDSVEDNVKLKSYRVFRDGSQVEEIEAWNCDYGTWTQFAYRCINRPDLSSSDGLNHYTLESTRVERDWDREYGKLYPVQLYWKDPSPGLAGRHVYQVQAVDMAGNESALSESVAVEQGAGGGSDGAQEDTAEEMPRISLSKVRWRVRKRQSVAEVSLVVAPQVALRLVASRGSAKRNGTCRRSGRRAKCAMELKKGRWTLELRGARNDWEPITQLRTLTVRSR